MTTTSIDDTPTITRTDAHDLALTEYGRLADQLRSLDAEHWSRPTDCPLWDVRAMAGHCAAMASDFTSYRSLLPRIRAATKDAKRTGGPMVDSMSAMQVAETSALTPAKLVAHIEAHGPRAARWRTTRPRLLRAMKMEEEVGGQPEKWRLGYLLDTILTRDTWMHRIDVARATGLELILTPDHDGRIVADIVVEWARRHGQPFDLTLTGPAGGRFTAGDEPQETLSLDAIEFCRILSGRAPGEGLLAQPVPF